MDPNPYAPPAGDAGSAPSGVVFSEEGLLVVNSLARWMAVLGFIFAGSAVLLGLAALFALVTFFPVGLALGLVAGLAWMGGVWLRFGGDAFQHGVAGDDEMAIGKGFGMLRSYFILVGVLALLQCLQALIAALEVVS